MTTNVVVLCNTILEFMLMSTLENRIIKQIQFNSKNKTKNRLKQKESNIQTLHLASLYF